MQTEELKKKIQVVNLPEVNSSLTGIILEKKSKTLFIDLSPYGTGIVRGPYYLEAKDYIKNLNVSDKVTVKVLDWNNEEGFIELALKDLVQEKTWDKIKELKEENITLPLLITEVNAGGLMGKIDNIQGFLPVSQLSSEHYPKVEGGSKTKILEKLKEFVGKEILVKIYDADANTNKLIFSEKLVELDQLKEIAKNYKVNDIVKIKITKIVSFGAFVKVDDTPLDGLIHISEISNKPNLDINKELKEGDVKKAKIISIDDGKISLSLKALESNPKEEPIKKS
ncbi:MAG: S1 RNA-binding domain-containing protein [Parcubacteria group bacterium]|nr:S1 RNA-binding domain-containing protein [Parcubacteria group bacterium]